MQILSQMAQKATAQQTILTQLLLAIDMDNDKELNYSLIIQVSASSYTSMLFCGLGWFFLLQTQAERKLEAVDYTNIKPMADKLQPDIPKLEDKYSFQTAI